MLIGGSTSLDALEAERKRLRSQPRATALLTRTIARLAPTLAGPSVRVTEQLSPEDYDLKPALSEAELRHAPDNSYLRYSAYRSRSFLIAEGREIMSARHSKAIVAPGRGLIDEFNVGGGAGMPAYLLEQDFERRGDVLELASTRVERIRGFSIPLCHYGVGTFGHFILDALLQLYVFRRELSDDARLLHWLLPETWMGPVLDRCGAGRRREVSDSVVQMERAGLSSALAGHGVYFPGSWSVRFFAWLRTCLQIPAYSGGGRLFVRRSPAFGRVISNAKEVETLACSHGFLAISPEDLPIEAQMRAFASSEVVLSPWGSTLTLSPMLAGEKIVIELLPSSVRDAWFPRQAVVHGLNYRPLLQASDEAGNMEIDLDALEILLRALPA